MGIVEAEEDKNLLLVVGSFNHVWISFPDTYHVEGAVKTSPLIGLSLIHPNLTSVE